MSRLSTIKELHDQYIKGCSSWYIGMTLGTIVSAINNIDNRNYGDCAVEAGGLYVTGVICSRMRYSDLCITVTGDDVYIPFHEFKDILQKLYFKEMTLLSRKNGDITFNASARIFINGLEGCPTSTFVSGVMHDSIKTKSYVGLVTSTLPSSARVFASIRQIDELMTELDHADATCSNIIKAFER